MATVAGWWAGLAGYAAALLLTGIAGPYWALWLWSVPAFPAYVTAARARGHPARGVVGVWLALGGVVPAVAVAAEHARWRPWLLEPLGVVAGAATIIWPVVVTVGAHRLVRAGRTPGAA